MILEVSLNMAERISFHPDLSSLMSVHCGNKDTFLRPLLALSAKSLDRGRLDDLSKVENLFIKIIPDKVAKTLTLLDNGAGMTESDLVALGTVAKGVDPLQAQGRLPIFVGRSRR